MIATAPSLHAWNFTRLVLLMFRPNFWINVWVASAKRFHPVIHPGRGGWTKYHKIGRIDGVVEQALINPSLWSHLILKRSYPYEWWIHMGIEFLSSSHWLLIFIHDCCEQCHTRSKFITCAGTPVTGYWIMLPGRLYQMFAHVHGEGLHWSIMLLHINLQRCIHMRPTHGQCNRWKLLTTNNVFFTFSIGKKNVYIIVIIIINRFKKKYLVFMSDLMS